MEPFEIRTRIFPKDLLAFKYYMFYRRYWILPIVGLVPVIELGLFWLMGQNVNEILGHLVLTVMVFIVLPLVMKFSNQRNYDKASAQFENILYTLTEEGIGIKAEGVDSKMAWQLFHAARETHNYYLLYQNKGAANIIPKRAFANQAVERRFVQILETHLSKKQNKL
ncbi:MAG: YcxB family protein [Bacteroidia bacterium]